MLVERCLNFGRVDIFASTNDQILFSVNEIDISLVVYPSDVSGT